MIEEERIIDGRTASPNEENVDRALRPLLLKEYVGQEAIREQLQIFIAAAKRRGERSGERARAAAARHRRLGSERGGKVIHAFMEHFHF